MRRRKPDTMEIQQMKAQAKEEKQRRLIEKNKLAKEVEKRKIAEREKQQLEQQLMQLQNEMRSASEALVSAVDWSISELNLTPIFTFISYSAARKKLPRFTLKRVASKRKKHF